MDFKEELNEKLREVCCLGDIEGTYKCLNQGADINAQNKMNGWTSLHWAAKRGHTNLIEILLKVSANPDIKNNKNETPFDMATNDDVRTLLKESMCHERSPHAFRPIQENGSEVDNEQKKKSTFIPNYMSHPVFPYVNNPQNDDAILHNPNMFTASQPLKTNSQSRAVSKVKTSVADEEELVLKVRIADSPETDFIEIELNHNELTFDNLIKICFEELEINSSDFAVTKIRKLPNTIIRKDKDVKRLHKFQEVELVLMKPVETPAETQT